MMFSQIPVVVFLAAVPSALCAPTLSYTITEFIEKECPDACLGLTGPITEEQFKPCEGALQASTWEKCSFKGVMSLSGEKEIVPCTKESDTATVAQLDLSFNDILAIPDLTKDSSVTLKYKAAIGADCQYWTAPIEINNVDTCNIDLSNVNLGDPADFTATSKDTSLKVTLGRLANLGLATQAKRLECVQFVSVDYSNVKWDFTYVPFPPTSGSSQMFASLLLSLMIAFVSIIW